MNFVTTYNLVQPNDTLSLSQDELLKRLLGKFVAETKCKAQLIDNKIVFNKAELGPGSLSWSFKERIFSSLWVFTMMTDGSIKIIQKEPYLAVYGALYFPITAIIVWALGFFLMGTIILKTGAPAWFVFIPVLGFVIFVAGSWIRCFFSFKLFIRDSIGTVGKLVDIKQAGTEL